MKIIGITKKKINRQDTMPDIDTDTTSTNRDDVKGYFSYKYTEDQVCSLGTYGRLKLRQAFKDLARIVGVPFKEANELTKNMDDQLEFLWSDLFKFSLKSELLYDFIQNNKEMVMDLKVIMNNPKSLSVHPSAIAVLPKFDEKGKRRTLETWMPIREIDGHLVSEWEGKYTDRFGILKEDILGIAQLDKYTYCLNLIKQNHNIDLDLEKIPFDDKKVFELFSRGLNEDVFQFGSFGLKNFSKEVQPDSLEELTAMSALYRPATMEIGAHKDFVSFKHGKKKPIFDFNMKSVTHDTQGIYIYQEQVMQAVVVGGLTLLESDQMRTAIKKKDTLLMGKFKVKFLVGMEEQGCSREEAEQIWVKLLSFAGYGFNKCLSKDSYIKTTKGDINVVDLHGDFLKGIKHTLYSVDNNNKIIEQELSKVFYQGKQRVYELELEDGKKIKVTDNHRLLTKRGYVELKNFKRDESIVTLTSMKLISSKVKSVKFVDVEDTYDIEMPTHHNFVCNDIISHNSHSFAYSVMTYWCMWLKANYPLEFYTTAMNFGKEDVDMPHILKEIQEVDARIKVDKPDVNKSSFEFTCDPDENRIFWSLEKIKGVGEVATMNIVNTRGSEPFKSLEDFCNRVPSKVNKSVIKKLILSGGFDSLYHVKQNKGRLEILQDFYELKDKKAALTCDILSNPARNKNYYWTLLQKSLIGNGELDYKELILASENYEHIKDYDYIEIKEILKKKTVSREFYNKGKLYATVGDLIHFKVINSKKGDFCVLELSANNSNIEVTIWNSDYEQIKHEIPSWKGKMVFLTAKIGFDDFRKRNRLNFCENSVVYEL